MDVIAIITLISSVATLITTITNHAMTSKCCGANGFNFEINSSPIAQEQQHITAEVATKPH